MNQRAVPQHPQVSLELEEPPAQAARVAIPHAIPLGQPKGYRDIWGHGRVLGARWHHGPHLRYRAPCCSDTLPFLRAPESWGRVPNKGGR